MNAARRLPEAATAPSRGALLGYIESLLLELAQMASDGGESGVAASLAVAALQCGTRRKAVD